MIPISGPSLTLGVRNEFCFLSIHPSLRWNFAEEGQTVGLGRAAWGWIKVGVGRWGSGLAGGALVAPDRSQKTDLRTLWLRTTFSKPQLLCPDHEHPPLRSTHRQG